jgi:hypothetical protein
MQDFRKLKVWQKSHSLALHVYAKTANFPKTETFGVTAQTRRAAVSIAANIAEGCARSGDKEFARFLVADLGFLKRAEAAKIASDACEIKRMLSGLVASLPIQRRSDS